MNTIFLSYIFQVKEDQVVMSHSPFKMFKQFHDKHILVSGQGPVLEIARALGFNNITSMETLRQCFPHLDMVDHRRRKPAVRSPTLTLTHLSQIDTSTFTFWTDSFSM